MKRDEIIVHLKGLILSGELATGSYLPLRRKLLEYCEASNVTVQRAVNRLVEEGFLCSCGSHGIMVSKTPPHRCRFGILVPAENRPEENDYDSRWASIEEAIREIETEDPQCGFVRYYIDSGNQPQEPEFKRLLHDLKNALIAGVIVTYSMEKMLLTQLDGYPVVLYEPKNRHQIQAVSFGYDYPAMTAMAVKELKRRGAKRIALIMNAELDAVFSAEVERVMITSGVKTRREWIHAVSRSTRASVWTGRIIQLLFLPAMPETPDGLIILNENLTPYALEALGELGKTIGRDIHLCCHCNIPSDRPLHGKVAYVAFDAHRMLLDSMMHLRNFGRLDKEFFEHEILVAPVPVRRPDARRVAATSFVSLQRTNLLKG